MNQSCIFVKDFSENNLVNSFQLNLENKKVLIKKKRMINKVQTKQREDANKSIGKNNKYP